MYLIFCVFILYTVSLLNLFISPATILVTSLSIRLPWWLRHSCLLPTMRKTWIQSLGQEDLLEKEMATHCSILAWKIPWTKESGGLQFMGLQRVGHNLVTEQQQDQVGGNSNMGGTCLLGTESQMYR